MKNKSIWLSSSIKNRKMNKLDKDIFCDVLIVGGGMAGLSVAYNLMNSDKKVVLIERDICGMGATSRNTGKLTWMQDLVYSRLSKNYNNDIAKLYYDSQVDAIKMVKDIITNNKIECHLVKTKSYIFSYTGNDYNVFSDEINFYKKYNIKYKLVDDLPLKYPCKYALMGDGSYVFNPYEYLVGLKDIISKKVEIYENTRCISVDKDNDNQTVLLTFITNQP